MLGYNENMKPNKLDHLSPSSIAQFLRCAHQWKLERVDRIPRAGSMALVGGLAWHEVSAANFLQKIETGNDLSEHELRKLFEKYFQKKLDESRIYVPPGESLKDLVEEAHARLINLVSEYVEYAKNIMPIEGGIEKRLVIPGTDLYPDIICYIDLIDDQRNVRDLKTTKKEWGDSDVDMDIQLSAYGLAYRMHYGQDANGFSYDFLVASGKRTKHIVKRTSRTAKHFVAFLKRASFVWEAHKAGIYPPANKGWWCTEKYCSHWAHCEYIPK